MRRFLVSAFTTASLAIAPIAPAALVLTVAGCATTATPTTGISTDAIAKLDALTQGLLSIAGTEATILGVQPDKAAAIAQDAQLAQTALAALQPGLATLTAAPSVETIVAQVNRVLAIVGPIASALPSPANQIVLALQVLLPVAEAAAGIMPPAGAMAVAGAGAPRMDPVAAQAYLAGVAH